jgi:hypothetical protein
MGVAKEKYAPKFGFKEIEFRLLDCAVYIDITELEMES